MDRVGARFVGLLVALVFFLPLTAINGGRGLFIPSARWEAYALGAYWIITPALVIFACLLHWALAERVRPVDDAAKMRRLWFRLITGFVLIVLPVWTLGIVHGFLRGVVDEPPLERRQIAAMYDSYHSSGGRHRSHWVVLRSPDFGTVRISVPGMQPDELPQKGDEVLIFGNRTWIGDRYDEVELDPANCTYSLKRSFETNC